MTSSSSSTPKLEDLATYTQAEGDSAFLALMHPYLIAMPEMTIGEVVDTTLRLISEGSAACYVCTHAPPTEDGADEDAWREAVARHRVAHGEIRGAVLGLASLAQGHPVGQLRPVMEATN